jgi:hypothetical protein
MLGDVEECFVFFCRELSYSVTRLEVSSFFGDSLDLFAIGEVECGKDSKEFVS